LKEVNELAKASAEGFKVQWNDPTIPLLVVERQQVPEEPQLSMPLNISPWVDINFFENESVKPIITFKEQIEWKEDDIELFSQDQNRVINYRSFKQKFDDYYYQYWNQIRINRLYDKLHALYYELKGKEQYYFALSFGLVTGTIEKQRY